MFLLLDKRQFTRVSFLHARGDVSKLLEIKTAMEQFSPRTWRCFAFGRSALKSLAGFLHARGDVSTPLNPDLRVPSFSPRTWRVTYVILK